MNEKKAYKKLREKIIKFNDRIDRIENYIVAGMPDINLCIEGCEFWIELKAPTEPKRATTPLFGSNHKLSQAQKNWFKRQWQSGGQAFILIVSFNRWILMPCDMADDINEMTIKQLVEKCLWTAKTPIKKEQWQILRQTLASTKQNHTSIN